MSEFTENMSGQEQAIKKFLHIQPEKQNGGHAIHDILAEAVRYYDADRSNIFELNADGTAISNTYQWSRDGISAHVGSLHSIYAPILKMM